MRKIIFVGLIILSLLVLTSVKSIKAKEESPDRRLVIQSDQPIQGPLFKTAESIYLQGEVDGDVFLLGGEVIVDATINGDLIIAAGQAEIKGKVLNDLRLVAGQAEIDASINGNASLISGQISLQPGSIFNNYLVVVAALIDYNGQVAKNSWFNAARIRFNGQADKNVFINAGTVDIYSDAVVNGNLKITYGEKPIISNRAVIAGDLIEEKSLPLEGRPSPQDMQPDKSSTARKITAFIILQKLVALSVNVLIGWLLITLLPISLSKKLVKISRQQTGSAIGLGFLTLFLTPIIGAIFTLSLIGIPLGVLTFLYYAFSLYLAQLVTGLIIGHHLLKDSQFKKPYLSLLLGMVILTLLRMIAFLGWIAYFILILFGLGTLTIQEKSVIARLRIKKRRK